MTHAYGIPNRVHGIPDLDEILHELQVAVVCSKKYRRPAKLAAESLSNTPYHQHRPMVLSYVSWLFTIFKVHQISVVFQEDLDHLNMPSDACVLNRRQASALQDNRLSDRTA